MNYLNKNKKIMIIQHPVIYPCKYMSENTEGETKNGQSRGTGNIGYTRRRKQKQKHNTIYLALGSQVLHCTLL